jgi:outer membrane biosynthesis protein TonB
MQSSKFLTVVLLAVATAATSFALGTKVESWPAGAQRPVALHVVAPTELPRAAIDSVVQVVMTIDAEGVPHDISVVSRTDSHVSSSVVRAVSQWRFSPMYQDGHARTARVILPLKLVQGEPEE